MEQPQWVDLPDLSDPCNTVRRVPHSHLQTQRVGFTSDTWVTSVHFPYRTPGAGTFSVLMFHITFLFLFLDVPRTFWHGGWDYEPSANSFSTAS